MDMNMLRYHMGKHGDKQSDLARAIGLRQPALSARMNGHIDFRKDEMNAIRKRYDLTAEEMQEIFFAS